MKDRIEQRIAELSEQLNLTDKQKDAISPIIEKEIKEIQALRADTTLSKEEKIERMKTIRQTAQEEIKKILTAEQQAKLTEAKEEMEEEAKENVAQMVQQRMTALSEKLWLTDEQKQKIQPILENEIKELSTVRDDETLSREQKQEKWKTIRQTAREEINKVLTPEQKAKFEEGKKRGGGKEAGQRITDGNDKN
jgi:Spy/CpxP family protein refolding chaperone